MLAEEEEEIAADWLKEAQKGYIRIAVLILLSKNRCHGYEMMKEVEARTKGFWRPTAGGIYPILQSLEKSGYIEGEWFFQKKRKRKVYRITESGRLILERALFRQSQIAKSMSRLFEEFARDVLDVETKSLPTPPVLNPFSVFLQKSSRESEDGSRKLERERKRIEQMIEVLQDQLRKINMKLAQLNDAHTK